MVEFRVEFWQSLPNVKMQSFILINNTSKVLSVFFPKSLIFLPLHLHYQWRYRATKLSNHSETRIFEQIDSRNYKIWDFFMSHCTTVCQDCLRGLIIWLDLDSFAGMNRRWFYFYSLPTVAVPLFFEFCYIFA